MTTGGSTGADEPDERPEPGHGAGAGEPDPPGQAAVEATAQEVVEAATGREADDVAEPTDAGDAGAGDSEAGARTPEAEKAAAVVAAMASIDAQRALWPWVAQKSRAQVVALIVVSCLSLGPLVALVAILSADPTPVHQLIEPAPAAPDISRVTATALGLSPTAGELRVRIVVDPAEDLEDDNGRLAVPISVVLNNLSGATTRAYEVGDSPIPFEATLPLEEGSTNRYPFDRYRGSLIVVLNDESAGDPEPQLVDVGARSVIDDFNLSAGLATEAEEGPQALTVIRWNADRTLTTTVYAIWLMLLMWVLAVMGLLIIWAVVIWMVEVPFWVFGYFVGVLFALPPLRDSLPGRPPPGTIFDYGSFYWAVTVSGVNLILMLGVYLRRTQAKERLRRLDPSRPE
ncbi:MAG: DUF4436 family protein [Acidimicrobiales bacterium]|nr:DUF4436 family protein [Acidimicrobiales bacterium]